MNALSQNSVVHRLGLYARLVRVDKPIGTLLLLWPTLWSLWIAAQGVPPISLIVIFTLGTFLMRAAGCAINDYFDRDFDLHVKRTKDRVLTTGQISPLEALMVAAVLAFVAFLLVLLLNPMTVALSVVALAVAGTYPLMKRLFGVPQAYLGIAFGFGIPMSFTAVTNTLPAVAWVLLLANIFWAIAYDTEYAMVDRDDDLRLGIKASAITFGDYDILAVGLSYAAMLAIMAWVGVWLSFDWPYALGLIVAGALAVVHLYWIRDREREPCFRAFRHNNWFGAAVFAGVVLQYALMPAA